MKKCVLVLLLLSCVGSGAAINDDAWADDMSDWGYRIPITITNPPTAANVQRMITLTYQENMQADFDDIRFYTASGDSIDYWIEEKTDSTSADVWVELPGASMTYIYAYYDNPDAEDASDGDAVFDLWDDFNGPSLDALKWNSGQSPTVSDSSVTINGAGEYISSVSTYGTNIILEAYGSIGDANYHNFGFGPYDNVPLIYYQYGYPNSYYNTRTYATGGAGTNLGSGYAGMHRWKITRNASSSVIFNIDGNNVATHSTQVPTGTLGVLLSQNPVATGGSSVFDYIFVRMLDTANTSFDIGTPEQQIIYVIAYPGYNIPTDQDSDGLYEDVNGNSRLDFQDIMIFFQYNAWAQANQPNVSCFDWSGNGAIEFSDVQEFWESEFT